MMLEWRTFVLVGNESALLHRLRKVKIVLLGQFKFRVDSVWELIWQSRLDGLQGALTAGGVCPLPWVHLQATRDGGVALGWEHGTANLFPHTGTPETAVWWLPFLHHLSEGSVREWNTAHLPLLLQGGLCLWHRPLCYVSRLSQMPSVLCGSVLPWAAWVKPFLCCALCAHLGRRRCLKRFLCGRQCVSVAVFASVWWGAGGPRLTAPTVVLQAPGWVGACQQFDWRGLFDTSEAANHILPASP